MIWAFRQGATHTFTSCFSSNCSLAITIFHLFHISTRVHFTLFSFLLDLFFFCSFNIPMAPLHVTPFRLNNITWRKCLLEVFDRMAKSTFTLLHTSKWRPNGNILWCPFVNCCSLFETSQNMYTKLNNIYEQHHQAIDMKKINGNISRRRTNARISTNFQAALEIISIHIRPFFVYRFVMHSTFSAHTHRLYFLHFDHNCANTPRAMLVCMCAFNRNCYRNDNNTQE